MINKETIERIKETANNQLVEVIRTLCPGINLQRQGISYRACCPFHSERTPSFYVTPSKHRWQCFGGCGEGGDAVSFVMKLNNCNFMEAIHTLADITHIYIPSEFDNRPYMDKIKPVTSYNFEFRPLSASDLSYCGISGIDEADIHSISVKLMLFAVKSYTTPARRNSCYSWLIREKPGYPILVFRFKNTDRTEWGIIYQPEAPEGKKLQNFGIQKEGTSFCTEPIRDFIRGLRSGEIKDVKLKGLV